MYNIIRILNIRTVAIDISDSKKDLWSAINHKYKVKGGLIMEDYDDNSVFTVSNGLVYDTSVDLISSGLFEVSHTEKKVTLAAFYHYLSILTGVSITDIDLCSYDAIYHLNKTSLLQIDDNSLIYTEQYHDLA